MLLQETKGRLRIESSEGIFEFIIPDTFSLIEVLNKAKSTSILDYMRKNYREDIISLDKETN